MIQPWEYGSIPAAWVEPINTVVDELWVPSTFVRDCYVQSGIKGEKVHVVPNGVATDRLHPAVPPRRLATNKAFRFLFVGGTLQRKGIDLLLAAYAAEFTSADDVCLVIKDMGGASVYKGQTAAETIRSFQANPAFPELLYLDEMLNDDEMAALYTACHCLVHPYRGEGFGLPIAEAMACGLPVIVTGMGAALDFCNADNAWLIPARRVPLGVAEIGGMKTVDVPWLAEPDLEVLQKSLHYVHNHRDEARKRGLAGCQAIRDGFTWQRAGAVAANRLMALTVGIAQPTAMLTDTGTTEEPAALSPAENALRTTGYRLAGEAITEGYRLAMRGEIDEAVNMLLDRGIRFAPALPEPYLVLIDILCMAKRHHDAFEVLREVPGSTDVATILAWRATCLCGMGNDELARQAAESAIIVSPANARALNVLGILAQRREDADEAKSCFMVASEADPGFREPYANLAVLLWHGGEQLQAFGLLKKSVGLSPLSADILALLQSAALHLGTLDEVATLLGAAAARYPENRLVAVYLIDTLIRLEKYEEGMTVLEKALMVFGADDDLLDVALEVRNQIGRPDAFHQGETTTVSLCMIVKNEAVNLARCLGSVKPVVHEMVVVDTGSSDRTVDIATAFGARVYTFDWNGSFSDARNYAISKARCAWILIMDADESISPLDHENMRRMLQSSSPARDAWSVLIRNYSHRVHIQGWQANDATYPDQEEADGWYPAVRVRLFPRDARIRFEGVVHEMVESSLRANGFRIHTSPIIVHHYGEVDGLPANLHEKQQRYFALGKQKLAEHPDDPVALTELAVQAGELGLWDDALELWDRLLAQRPATVEALFSKGHVLINLKRHAEALDVSRQALGFEPGHREAAFNYGTCELYVGDPARALPVIEQLVQRDGRHPLLQALLAVLCLASGRTDQARRSYEAIMGMGYAFHEYLQARIATLENLGRAELAHAIGKQAEKTGILTNTDAGIETGQMASCRDNASAGN